MLRCPVKQRVLCLRVVQARSAASRARGGRPRSLPPAFPSSLVSGEGSSKANKVSRRPTGSPLAAPVRYGTFGDEIRANMDKFPDAILLTQVGKFYESYFEQAAKVAETCRITLTSKDWTIKDTGLIERAPFAGFPLSGLTKHLRTLVDAFGAVVLVDEVDFNDDNTKKRAITRIVTPATLLDDGLFDASVPNYLLAISSGEGSRLSLAWVDPSTGDFFEQEAELEDLRDVVVRVSPVEIVLRPGEPHIEQVKAVIEGSGTRLSILPQDQDVEGMPATELAVAYLGANLPMANANWDSSVETLSRSSLMRIDANAFIALEIRTSSHRSSSALGSLLHAVKKTVTPGGSRLLLQRLSAPSTDLAEIERRHNLVEALTQLKHKHEALGAILGKCGDHARVVQQARRQRGQPSLLVALRDLLQGVHDLKELLSDCDVPALKQFADMLTPLPHLSTRLAQIIRPDALFASAGEGEEGDAEAEVDESSGPAKGSLFSSWTFAVQENASRALSKAHDELSSLQSKALALQESLRQDNGINRIHLSVSARGEPFIRLTGRGELAGQRLIRTLKGSKHYEVEAWTSLHRSLLNQRALILDLEAEVLGQLQNAILAEAVTLRKNGQILDELDVGRSFALLAIDRGYVRPSMTDQPNLQIVDGLHPVVAEALNSSGQHFTPNSLSLGGDEPAVSIVTGPNMGGKSTFLRQAALLVILAQAGGFVPAASATIGICDAIFTRVGASDDLFRGQSTFMLEMSETAHILQHATSRSLVIMDEIGRGTAPNEGLAIAYAVADHLVTSNAARTLFATHFHSVIDMLENDQPGRVSLLCTEIDQDADGTLTFSHKVRQGANREAGALLVAKHAGVPQSVLDKAQNVLVSNAKG